MAFKLLNTDAVKLDSDELIAEAFDNYCAHVAKGNSAESWGFKKDGKDMCCYLTMQRYMKSRPDVCIAVKYNMAVSSGMVYWENVVSESGNGKNTKANTATLQMIMRNKYGWDAKEKEDDESKIQPLTHLSDGLAKHRAQPAAQAIDHND